MVIQTRAEQIIRDAEKESFKITGLVQDKKKEALPGVTVLLKERLSGWQRIKMENSPLKCLKWIVSCWFFFRWYER